MAPTTGRTHGAGLSFEYERSDAAALVADAVRQEVGEIEGGRTSVSVHREGRKLRVDIDADDLVALRAGLNTWETLVEVAERMVVAGRTADA